MNLLCRHCGRIVANDLKPVDDGFVWSFEIERDVVPPGRFAIGDGQYSEDTKGRVFVHLDNAKDLIRPPNDEFRGYGCCGYWDDQGPNLVCPCGAELGYELSDCCAPRAAYFSKTDVILVDAALQNQET